MYYPDENDPYAQSGQEALPYQPYREYAGPIQYSQQQREVLSPPTTYRSSPGASYNTSARSSQVRPTQLRMSKAEALEFVGRCKKWLVAGSFISFGVISGLVSAHTTGATSQQTTPASNSPATSPSSGGNYFQPQPGGGSNFGNNNPFQPPVSSSRVS
jgi:hypothetical protein